MGEANVEQHIIADKTLIRTGTDYIVDTNSVFYPFSGFSGIVLILLPSYHALAV